MTIAITVGNYNMNKGILTKICRICKKEKPENEFHYTKKRKYRRTECKKCHLKQNLERHSKLRIERKKKLVEQLGINCSKCNGVFPPACYDFHHLDPSTKKENPTVLLLCSEAKRQEMLENCILLCANCHRIEHAKHKEIPKEWL